MPPRVAKWAWRTFSLSELGHELVSANNRLVEFEDARGSSLDTSRVSGTVVRMIQWHTAVSERATVGYAYSDVISGASVMGSRDYTCRTD